MWVVWSVALAAYIVGVMHRTSFGVAGLDAAQRFHAGPAALSGFVVLQLLVYAALQVPVGLLLDRFGGRVLVAVGALTMATGQLVLALATTLPLAVTARVLIGTGDGDGVNTHSPRVHYSSRCRSSRSRRSTLDQRNR